MNVLALDLGAHTGFALDVNGDLASGVQDFAKMEHPGHRFRMFNLWLADMALGPRPEIGRKVDLIIYEKPLGRMAKGQAQVDLSIGFKTRIEEFCWRWQIRMESVPISTLKKATTGSGKATKEQMVDRINMDYARNLEYSDHDEADALALLSYSKRFEPRLLKEAA